MAVSAEVSVVSAIPARPSRSRSNRPTISAAKCWLSAAEPPLPHESTLHPALSASARASPARAICAGRFSAMRWRSSMPSSKCFLRWATWSICLFPLARSYPGTQMNTDRSEHRCTQTIPTSPGERTLFTISSVFICVHLCQMPLARITRGFYFTGLQRSLEPDDNAAVEGDDVEAARGLARRGSGAAIPRAPSPRRGLDARALAPADALGPAAEAIARAHAHLDEHERRAQLPHAAGGN